MAAQRETSQWPGNAYRVVSLQNALEPPVGALLTPRKSRP
jgi:hypothetical protein